MFTKLHHIIIDLLFGFAGFASGWGAYWFFYRRSPIKGISGQAFAHTIENVNKIVISQNVEISILSQKLTDAQIQIEALTTQNIILEKRVKALTDEVERLVTIIHRYNDD